MNDKSNVFQIYSNINYDDFAFIRPQIDNTFKFTMYTLKPTDPNINIIYENPENFMYIGITGKTYLFDRIVAIQDQIQYNRFFIGFYSNYQCVEYYVTGIIIYFSFNKQNTIDEEKNMPIIQNILNCIVYKFDCRNSLPLIYLYNQSLVFIQHHRDTGKLLIGLNILNYNDNVMHTHNAYTNIITNRWFTKCHYNYINKTPRFMIVNGVDNILYIFDLASLKYIQKNNTQSSLFIDHYIANIDNIDGYISHINTTQKPEYYGIN